MSATKALAIVAANARCEPISVPLPYGWQWVKLGDYVENHDGRRVPVSSRDRKARSGQFPYYGASGIIDSIDGYTHNDEFVLVGEDGANLLSRSKPIAFLARGKIWVNNHAHVLKCQVGYPNAYLAYYLNSIDLSPYVTGTAQPKLSQAMMNKIPVPVAPPERQWEIVAELEKQFSRLDEAVANLERVTGNLKRYRNAVLAAAADGSIIGGPPAAGIPIGSTIAMLDQGWSPQCESETASRPDEWAVIKTTAIQPMAFQSAENKRLPQALEARPGLELRAGDLLVTRAGPRSRVGVACAVRSTRPRLMLCDKAYRIRLNGAVAEPRYMEIVLNAPMVRDAIDELKTGISDSGVNLTQKRFRELCVPVPSLVSQSEIVAEVDRRLSIVPEVEAEVDANLKRAQALRQAVLQRVFASEDAGVIMAAK